MTNKEWWNKYGGEIVAFIILLLIVGGLIWFTIWAIKTDIYLLLFICPFILALGIAFGGTM